MHFDTNRLKSVPDADGRGLNSHFCDLNHDFLSGACSSNLPAESTVATRNLLCELVEYLPRTKERSRELIDRYVSSVGPLLPFIIDLECFVPQHDLFCALAFGREMAVESPGVAHSFNLILFYAQYFAVLAAATVAEFEEYNNLLLIADISRYRLAFHRVRSHQQYPHGILSMSFLTGSILIESTAPTTSFSEVADIVLYAKRLQLDRDPMSAPESPNTNAIISRRAVWMSVVGLDAAAAKYCRAAPILSNADLSMPTLEEICAREGRVLFDVSVLTLNIRHMCDRIVSRMGHEFYRHKSELPAVVVDSIKTEIATFHDLVQRKVARLKESQQRFPLMTVAEAKFSNFVQAHVYSYVDRLLLWLHLMSLRKWLEPARQERCVSPRETDGVHPASSPGKQSASGCEFDSVAILREPPESFLRPGNVPEFDYLSLESNLVPSIVHSLGEFLKYNDFISFGRFSWFAKRCLPCDGLAMMLLIFVVKFKHQSMMFDELELYLTITSQVLALINCKWSKAEKKRQRVEMFNIVWEMIIQRFRPFESINSYKVAQQGDLFGFCEQVTRISSNVECLRLPRPTSRSSCPGAVPSTRRGVLDQANGEFSTGSVRVPAVIGYFFMSPDDKLGLNMTSRRFDEEVLSSSPGHTPLESHTWILKVTMAFIRRNFIDEAA